MERFDNRLSRLDPEKLWDEISPQSRARLWICEHFGILPTDNRYKRLSDLQASLLFTNWLLSPEEQDVKIAYWTEKSSLNKSLPRREDLKAIGYSDAQVDEILKEITG